MTTVTIGRASKHKYEAKVTSAPSTLRSVSECLTFYLYYPLKFKVTPQPVLIPSPFTCYYLYSKYRWVFVTDGGSISFGVQYFPLLPNGVYSNKGDMVEPVQKVHSELVPEDGALICDAVGLCTYQ